ncbi:hypothetical protein GQ53DRAFT_707693 [Thozetella sp. PMI_491]|nr:hypothetical protein GQ53DRAFT_707693 [Thozetella sp. PMI_491]
MSAQARQKQPNRSHLQTACLPCRKRKSRCRIDESNKLPCLTCQFHGNSCQFSPPSEEPVAGRARRKVTSRLKQVSAAPSLAELGARSTTGVLQDSPAETSCPPETPFLDSAPLRADGSDGSHVIGPVAGPDTQLIAHYLMGELEFTRRDRFIVATTGQSLGGARPIMFNTVRRQPLGYSAGQSIASRNCQVVEKLIEPFCNELIDIYFRKVHICFPLVDELLFRQQYSDKRDMLSPAILTSLYAQGVIFWRFSVLSAHHRPDLRFVWNQANEALYSELQLSPGLSTIVTVLLNISGRPLTSMLGNGVLLGSAISLAQSLGLNHNCESWDISLAEKRLRKKIWWAIMIYDTWSSATYGTPPHLRANQHDVSPPTLADISAPDQSVDDNNAAFIYIGLIGLTKILATLLNHVFDMPNNARRGGCQVSLEIERQLAQWEDSLPHQLRRLIVRGTDMLVPGSANLRLSYLFVRFLARKPGIDSEMQNGNVATLGHRYLYARRAAEDIVLMIQELDDMALSDFWLSFNAFALSSTVAFLLRTALEAECYQTGSMQSISLKLAQDMIAALQSHRKRMGWDLANICLAQYSDVVERLAVSLSPLQAASELQQLLTSNIPDVDELFPNLWEMFSSSYDPES